MNNNTNFDFGALLDEQLKGLKQNYKFGRAFNDDKQIVRPKKTALTPVMSDDHASIKAAWEAGEAVSGLVEKEIKGGYEVTVAGARTFCPFSQIDKVRQDASAYIGRKFEFLVSEYSKDERGLNIVVSRRALIEVQEAALREATLAQLVEGETLNGTITRVLDFGAFVDLGGIEGLIPAREVAWERIDDLTSVLTPGAVVTVKILHIDRENEKISLSRRACLSRVFKKSEDEIAAEKSAAEVADWMANAAQKNASVGSLASAFDKLKL